MPKNQEHRDVQGVCFQVSSYQTDPTIDSNHKLGRKYEKKKKSYPKALEGVGKFQNYNLNKENNMGVNFPFYSLTISMEIGNNQ